MILVTKVEFYLYFVWAFVRYTYISWGVEEIDGQDLRLVLSFCVEVRHSNSKYMMKGKVKIDFAIFVKK